MQSQAVISCHYFNSWALQSREKQHKFSLTTMKLAAGGFNFPIFCSFFHTISSVLGMSVLMRLRPPQSGWPTLKQGWEYRWEILPISICHCANIGLNNISLMWVSLFINQIIKSTAPFPTMIAEYFLIRERQTWTIIGSVVLLVIGEAP